MNPPKHPPPPHTQATTHLCCQLALPALNPCHCPLSPLHVAPPSTPDPPPLHPLLLADLVTERPEPAGRGHAGMAKQGAKARLVSLENGPFLSDMASWHRPLPKDARG